MTSTKEVQTPMFVSAKLTLTDGSASCEATEYMHNWLSLIHLAYLPRPRFHSQLSCSVHAQADGHALAAC